MAADVYCLPALANDSRPFLSALKSPSPTFLASMRELVPSPLKPRPSPPKSPSMTFFSSSDDDHLDTASQVGARAHWPIRLGQPPKHRDQGRSEKRDARSQSPPMLTHRPSASKVLRSRTPEPEPLSRRVRATSEELGAAKSSSTHKMSTSSTERRERNSAPKASSQSFHQRSHSGSRHGSAESRPSHLHGRSGSDPRSTSSHHRSASNSRPPTRDRNLQGLVPGMLPGPNFGQGTSCALKLGKSQALQTSQSSPAVPTLGRFGRNGSEASESSVETAASENIVDGYVIDLIPKPLALKRGPSAPAVVTTNDTLSQDDLMSDGTTDGPRGRASMRENVPSMVEYLSLEQLETLWESQDHYGGPMPEAPAVQNTSASPLLRMAPLDPRSPILPLHPAFRKDPPDMHNSFHQ